MLERAPRRTKGATKLRSCSKGLLSRANEPSPAFVEMLASLDAGQRQCAKRVSISLATMPVVTLSSSRSTSTCAPRPNDSWTKSFDQLRSFVAPFVWGARDVATGVVHVDVDVVVEVDVDVDVLSTAERFLDQVLRAASKLRSALRLERRSRRRRRAGSRRRQRLRTTRRYHSRSARSRYRDPRARSASCAGSPRSDHPSSHPCFPGSRSHTSGAGSPPHA